jgi:hypothetical protein
VLVSRLPSQRGQPPIRRRVQESAAGVIDVMPREDLKGPRKQRRTIVRICQRLALEHGFEHASYSTIRDYVRRRPRTMLEAGEGWGHLEGTVPHAMALGRARPTSRTRGWRVDLAGQRRRRVTLDGATTPTGSRPPGHQALTPTSDADDAR